MNNANKFMFFNIKIKKTISQELFFAGSSYRTPNNNLIGKIKRIITDRGKEFSKWKEMEIFAETQVYFCDAGKPQQKQLIEHMNGEFRYWLSNGIDFNNISQKMINWIVNVINDKLRPCLNWLSAKTIFLQNFK